MKRSTLCLAQGVVLPTPIGMNHGSQQRRLITTFFKVTEITMEDNKMTFGKYKGQHIEQYDEDNEEHRTRVIQFALERTDIWK